MESLLLRTLPSHDSLLLDDDDDENDPLEDLKRFVATLNDQTDIDLENFRGIYDDDSDDDSDWGATMDFEKATSDFLSYAMGKENKTGLASPKSPARSRGAMKTPKALSRSNSLQTPRGLQTPRAVLTPRDSNVFDFEQTIPQHSPSKTSIQDGFGVIGYTLSEMLDEILSDDWKPTDENVKELNQNEETAHRGSAQTELNECKGTNDNMVQRNNEQDMETRNETNREATIDDKDAIDVMGGAELWIQKSNQDEEPVDRGYVQSGASKCEGKVSMDQSYDEQDDQLRNEACRKTSADSINAVVLMRGAHFPFDDLHAEVENAPEIKQATLRKSKTRPLGLVHESQNSESEMDVKTHITTTQEVLTITAALSHDMEVTDKRVDTIISVGKYSTPACLLASSSEPGMPSEQDHVDQGIGQSALESAEQHVGELLISADSIASSSEHTVTNDQDLESHNMARTTEQSASESAEEHNQQTYCTAEAMTKVDELPLKLTPTADDPYEWAYAVWRAKGLMGRTREDGQETPFKPKPSMAQRVKSTPVSKPDSKVVVVGTPAKEPPSTGGREGSIQRNKRTSGNFGDLMQRWKEKSDSTCIADLFSPGRSVKSDSNSVSIAKEPKRGSEKVTKMTGEVHDAAVLSIKVDDVKEFSISSDGVADDVQGKLNDNEMLGIAKLVQNDALLGMTIRDLKGRKSLFGSTPAKVFRKFLAQGEDEGSIIDDDFTEDDDGESNEENVNDDDSMLSDGEIAIMLEPSQIANTAHSQRCACASSAFSGNDVLEEFFLPQLGMACTCGAGKRRSLWCSDGNPDPTALEHILRPWQVSFCKSFGIQKGDQLVKAHHRSANMLAKAMRKWREAYGMTRVRTVSCGVALHIWARSCKYYVRSIRMQRSRGMKRLAMPDTMYCLTEMMSSSERRISVPASGYGFRTSSERAMSDRNSEREVEI